MQDQEPSFKGRDTSFGIFYPTGYIIAIFDSFDTAQRAKEIMLSAGYGEDEVDAVPGDYVISDIEEGTKNATFLNRVKQRISRAIGGLLFGRRSQVGSTACWISGTLLPDRLRGGESSEAAEIGQTQEDATL